MKEIFFIIYKGNPALHIICTVLTFFSLYLIFNQILYQTNMQGYEAIFQTEHTDDFYYYSSDTDLSFRFYDKLDEIQKIYPGAEIGYSLESTVTAEDGQEFSVVYLNSVMRELPYRLHDGTWISKENEIVVGRDASKKIKTGSLLTVKTQNGSDKNWKVAGSLENSYIMELSVSGTDFILPLLMDQKENVLLTTDIQLLDTDHIEYPRLGLILKITDADKKTANSDRRLTCLAKIIQNTKEHNANAIGNSKRLQILLSIAILLNILILSIYHLDGQKEFLSLAYVCGLEKWKLIFLETVQICIDYLMALPIIILSKCMFADPDINRMFLANYAKNFISSQVIFLCILIAAYCSVLTICMKRMIGETG